MTVLLRDPLLHFVVLGAALFVLLTRGEGEAPPDEIRVSADQVRIALRSRVPVQGEPSADVLDELVESIVRDEVLYREALALGLDVNDDQVRTRLIEKIRYLNEDLADPEAIDDAQLRAFFAANPERFEILPAVTFDHVFFSPIQRGESVQQQAVDARERLRAGGSAEQAGDSTPLGLQFEQAEAQRLEVLFGPSMTEAIFDAPDGVWSGPFESDFGLHLVRVTQRRSQRQPSFDEVRDTVADVFAQVQREQENARRYALMRERYDVVVEWPEELER